MGAKFQSLSILRISNVLKGKNQNAQQGFSPALPIIVEAPPLDLLGIVAAQQGGKGGHILGNGLLGFAF